MADAWPMELWRVIETNAGAERLAARSVAELGITVYLPLYSRRIRHARKSEIQRRALFPGYLFAEFSLDHPEWPRIFSRRGVRGMICDGAKPKQVPHDQMASVREIEKECDGVVFESEPMGVGQVIRIIEGVFAGRLAVIKRADNRPTVDIEITAFGRPTVASIPRNHVTTISG